VESPAAVRGKQVAASGRKLVKRALSVPTKPRGAQWTQEENDALRDAVMQYGERKRDWPKVAKLLAKFGRDKDACRQQWLTLRPPVKGSWTEAEDALLSQIVERSGPSGWSNIAKHIAGRNAKQCRERWVNHLNPAVKKTSWTAQEDALLLQVQAELGNKWSEIAKRLPGRPDNAVKNRWYTLKHRAGEPVGRKRQRRRPSAGQASKTPPAGGGGAAAAAAPRTKKALASLLAKCATLDFSTLDDATKVGFASLASRFQDLQQQQQQQQHQQRMRGARGKHEADHNVEASPAEGGAVPAAAAAAARVEPPCGGSSVPKKRRPGARGRRLRQRSASADGPGEFASPPPSSSLGAPSGAATPDHLPHRVAFRRRRPSCSSGGGGGGGVVDESGDMSLEGSVEDSPDFAARRLVCGVMQASHQSLGMSCESLLNDSLASDFAGGVNPAFNQSTSGLMADSFTSELLTALDDSLGLVPSTSTAQGTRVVPGVPTSAASAPTQPPVRQLVSTVDLLDGMAFHPPPPRTDARAPFTTRPGRTLGVGSAVKGAAPVSPSPDDHNMVGVDSCGSGEAPSSGESSTSRPVSPLSVPSISLSANLDLSFFSIDIAASGSSFPLPVPLDAQMGAAGGGTDATPATAPPPTSDAKPMSQPQLHPAPMPTPMPMPMPMPKADPCVTRRLLHARSGAKEPVQRDAVAVGSISGSGSGSGSGAGAGATVPTVPTVPTAVNGVEAVPHAPTVPPRDCQRGAAPHAPNCQRGAAPHAPSRRVHMTPVVPPDQAVPASPMRPRPPPPSSSSSSSSSSGHHHQPHVACLASLSSPSPHRPTTRSCKPAKVDGAAALPPLVC